MKVAHQYETEKREEAKMQNMLMLSLFLLKSETSEVNHRD
jgi:hypothetical protein